MVYIYTIYIYTILFLLSFRLNTALHYALLALLSLSTLVFRNNTCHCFSV